MLFSGGWEDYYSRRTNFWEEKGPVDPLLLPSKGVPLSLFVSRVIGMNSHLSSSFALFYFVYFLILFFKNFPSSIFSSFFNPSLECETDKYGRHCEITAPFVYLKKIALMAFFLGCEENF